MPSIGSNCRIQFLHEFSACSGDLYLRYLYSRNELSNLTFIFFECVLRVVFSRVLNVFSCVMIHFY